MKLRISGIENDSITDGPGIRFAVFTQGCDFRCEGCHNPQTWDLNGGVETDVGELLARIKSNPLLTGVTFSGGEPFLQAAALVELAKGIKSLGLELAIYTGYTWEELTAENKSEASSFAFDLLRFTDTLIDGRFILAEKTLELKFSGSRNQRIIDVQKSLSAGKIVLDISDRWN